MRGTALRLLAAVGIAFLVASIAVGLVPGEPSFHEGAVSPASEAHERHDHAPAAGTLAEAGVSDEVDPYQPRHEHPWTEEDGRVPTRAEASELEPHLEEFVVRGDEGLANMAERGYLDGEGTIEDPYVIDGFRVEDELAIRDTNRPLVIKNSYIDGRLELNYAGEHVHVHHNFVRDLRVNENVDREGPTTSGLFEHNEIAFIGQLRHFSGTFHDNEVGPRPEGVLTTYLSDTGPADLADDVVWNFDGYHGAHVHNNTVEGRVDVKLHGHFHGSCLACPAHAHHDASGFPEGDADAGEPRSMHSFRYHVFDIENNTIRAGEAEIALRIHDTAHAGDDQTANSEPNPYLEDRHEHHAYLRVHGNTIRDGALVFDVVNAEDDRHTGLVQETRIELTSNDLEREVPRGTTGLLAAYEMHAADTATLHAEDNRYVFLPEGSPAPEGYGWATDGEPGDATGFWLQDVNASQVHVSGTQGTNATYGLTLEHVRDNTPIETWDNSFGAKEAERHER